MSEMVNPHLLEAKYKPWKAGRWERKKYLAILSGNGYTRATRREFIRASDAESYVRRALARWVRLYEAAIFRMIATKVEIITDADPVDITADVKRIQFKAE